MNLILDLWILSRRDWRAKPSSHMVEMDEQKSWDWDYTGEKR